MKPDSNGFYPLHCAVMNSQIDSLKCLLNVYNCSPNVGDKNGNTCLHHACIFGFVDVVKLLINHPDIDLVIISHIIVYFYPKLNQMFKNCKNSDGKTCLNICEASNNSSSKICADLIKNRLKQAVNLTLNLDFKLIN